VVESLLVDVTGEGFATMTGAGVKGAAAGLLWAQALRANAPTVKPPVTIIFRKLVRGNTGAIKRRLARSLLLPILSF
jgi:hypothetical protein